MPTVSKPVVKKSLSVGASTANYVRFSDKLTGGLDDISRIINENKQTMDTVQEIGIEMTSTIAAIGTASVKYVRMIDGFLDTVVPMIEKVPFIDKKIIQFAKNAQNLSQTILDACTNSEKVAGDVRGALTSGDVSRLKGYSGDLQKLSKGLQGVTAKIK